MPIERMQVPVGAKFDSKNQQHIDVVMRKVAESGHGAGWEIQSFDPASGLLTLTRKSLLTQVAKDENPKSDSYQVELGPDAKPTDGAKFAAKFESDPRFAGYFMTKFDPYLNQATLSKLTNAERQCRSAVAVALNVKPWDVRVSSRRGGGFDVELPLQYVPSKFDVKLDEVAATIVGRPGWYWEGEPSAHPPRGRILPGDLPTFEPVYQFDFVASSRTAKTDKDQWRFPLGISLGGRGQPNQPLVLDLSDSVGLLKVGLAGAGKSTSTQADIYNALERGWQLALINTADKATDFAWAKPYVRENMWGCDSVAQSLTVAKLVIEEGSRRGALLSEYGVSKHQDLPADVREEHPPLLLVADELASLLTADPLPPGLPKEMKELPEFVKMQQDLLESKLLATALSTIPALYRAAGFRCEYITQQPSERYGFSAKLKGNLPHRIMLGTNPSEGEKSNAFRTPEKIPSVPANIATDKSIARGVGLAHLDGTEPAIFKGYYASLDDYIAATRRLGAPITLNPEPTPRQIARLVPRVDGGDGGVDDEPRFGKGPRKHEEWELDPETGEPLEGFARANAARAAATRAAKSA